MEWAKYPVDVVVLGSGPAGSAAALTLARGGASVLVVDRTGRPASRVGEVLPPSAIIILRELKVWERFCTDGHLPSYGNRSIWGSSSLDDYSFIFDPYGAGWHLDRARFDAMLLEAALAAGATRWSQTHMVRCSRSAAGSWELELLSRGNLSRIRADFVVDASGRSAVFARSQGARRATYDRMVGLVLQLCAAPRAVDQDSFTLIEAVEEGWWYAALLPTGRLAVIYMSDADLISARRVRTIEAWTGLLQETQAIRRRVVSSGYQMGEAPRVTCASSSLLNKVVGDSWLAVGDAATTHDPLSCHGITNALSSGLYAARGILAGRKAALEAYALWVQETYGIYLAYRAAYYAMENRWTGSTFWQRRNVVSR
jgi:flavin-dependent dehydrogenase